MPLKPLFMHKLVYAGAKPSVLKANSKNCDIYKVNVCCIYTAWTIRFAWLTKAGKNPIKSTKTHTLKRNACWHPRAPSHRQVSGVWKVACSVWHWLLCANSTLGDALGSFAANPGKEITDTHNAVFCLSAKKKTNPLSLYKRRYRHSHSLSPCPRSKPRVSFISRNMPSNMCPCSVARSHKAP